MLQLQFSYGAQHSARNMIKKGYLDMTAWLP